MNKFTACLGVWMHDWNTVGGTVRFHLQMLLRVIAERIKRSKYPRRQAKGNTTHGNQPTPRRREGAQPSTLLP